MAFIGIDSGDSSRADALAFLRAFPVSYPSYFDPSGQAGATITDSSFTPVTVFYDRRGRQFIHQGPYLERGQARTGRPALRADGLRLARTADRPAQRAQDDRRRRALAAPGRRADLRAAEPIDPAGDPFAEGHEDRTPPELYAVRPGGGPADSPGWTVRVVPNLYPALGPAGGDGAVPAAGLAAAEELFASLPATGAHEVIVNAPQSVLSLAELPVEQVVHGGRGVARADARARRQRLCAADRQRATRGGRVAAAHARAALRAGLRPRRRSRASASGRAPTRRGRWARTCSEDLVAEEVRRRERIVAIDDEAVLIAPYASRLPFQLMLAPRTPRARFEDEGPTGAALLHDGLRRLARHLGSSPPLNMWVRTAPRGTEDFCWRIDVLPRLTHLAGLELSTDVNLNIVAPEDAAAALRDA